MQRTPTVAVMETLFASMSAFSHSSIDPVPRIGLFQQNYFLTDTRTKSLVVSFEPHRSVFNAEQDSRDPFQVSVTLSKTMGPALIYDAETWRQLTPHISTMQKWTSGIMAAVPLKVDLGHGFEVEYGYCNGVPVVKFAEVLCDVKVFLAKVSIDRLSQLLNIVNGLINHFESLKDKVNDEYMDYFRFISTKSRENCGPCDEDKPVEHACTNEKEVWNVMSKVGSEWLSSRVHPEEDIQRIREEIVILCKVYTGKLVPAVRAHEMIDCTMCYEMIYNRYR